MKIKTDFITNSSSTSFILISDNEITESAFLKLLGIKPDSPFKPLFVELYNLVVENMTIAKDLTLRRIIDDSPDDVVDKIQDALLSNKKVFTGKLSSDNNIAESYFCTDSFEAENENIYFNYLECVW